MEQIEQRIVSLEDSILSLTRGHILGEKQPSSGHQLHPSDVSSLEDAQKLHLADFAKIATGFEGYIFPSTLNRSATATLLVDDASCSNLSPCHGSTAKSSHNSTVLRTGGIIM